MFGINDFDETLPGPFEWDVKRLVASFAVAGRDRGFNPKARDGDQPRGRQGPTGEAMQGFAAMRNLDVWYARLDVEALMQRASSRSWRPRPSSACERNVAKARTKDSLKAFAKLTQLVDGEPRIISDPPLIVPIDELVAAEQRDRDRARPSSG